MKKDVGEVARLRAQLASPAARTATWRLLMLHEPPWSQNWAPCDYNGEVMVRDLVPPPRVASPAHPRPRDPGSCARAS